MRSLGILFLLIFGFLASSVFADENKEKKEWLTCKEDADCVLVGVCTPQAVNKIFQDEAQDYYKILDATKLCANVPANDFQISCGYKRVHCGNDPKVKVLCKSTEKFCIASPKHENKWT